MVHSAHPGVERPLLIAVSARRRLRMPLLEWCRQLIDGGVDIIQLREPDLPDSELTSVARSVLAISGPERLQINGRPAVARELGCGLHLPERAVVENRAGSPVSRSIHNQNEAVRSGDFDFVVAGHLFATSSHPDSPANGLEWLRDIVAVSPVPVVAIGGIDCTNARACIANGAAGVAVIRALTDTSDPHQAARELRSALDAPLESMMIGEHMSESKNPTIGIVLNGKSLDLETGTTIAKLLEQRELVDRLVVVEVNGAIVPRSRFVDTVFEPGDLVEIVHFVGGG